MSLLMDALKQAEENKNKEASRPGLPAHEPRAGGAPDSQDTLEFTQDDLFPPSRVEESMSIAEEPLMADEAPDAPIPLLAAPREAQADEVPLAEELDFSEIEAAIATEADTGDSAPAVAPLEPPSEPPAPVSPLPADEPAMEAAAPAVTQASTDSARDNPQDKFQDNPGGDLPEEGVGVSGNGEGGLSLEPSPPASTADDAARLLAAGSRRQSRSRRRLFILSGVLLLVVLALVGAYYYWSRQLLVQPLATPASLPPSTPVETASEQPEEGPAAPVTEHVSPETAPAPLSPAESGKPSPRAHATATPAPGSTPAQARPAPPPRQAPPPPPREKQAPPAKQAAQPVIERHAGQPNTYQMLVSAYQAYQENRIQDARRLYEQVLDRQPRNRDALLGLASVAARQGREDEARALYRRQLVADPKDGVAQTGLLSLLSTGDPVANESLIKEMMREHGETHYLRFALGNVYAAQSRWEEAQQSYFRAYSAAPHNPNYLFNLAVSLDHLHQDRLALQYYRWALSQAKGQAVKFDVEGARQRVRTLTAAVSGETP
ncbi:MAG TPA: tetratricopeptide repeat protein [Chromatiales bacterium]|nr:tetratricopeptide repeat protein [Chromatiales bacterium]